MRINKDYFLPLVEEFCKTAKALGSGVYPKHALFVPYTFENYQSAPKKIFYIGRDSEGWIKFDEMMGDFENGNLDSYLEKNANVVTAQGENDDNTEYHDVHSLREGWNINNKWTFWTYCQKLHLYITKGYENVDITNLTEADYQTIEQMGYGNLNAIEHDGTLKKDRDGKCWWDLIADKEKFHQLRLASRKLDRIKHILDAYSPDLIIILNWEERPDVFEGIKETWLKEYYIDKLRAVYSIEGYDTKILWSNHPNARSISVFDRIRLIGDTAKELLNIK